jgi:hypothetical protein
VSASTCRLCHDPVLTTVTIGGRVLELDPEPGPDGNVLLVEHDGRPRARVLTGAELPHEDGDTYRRHRCTATPQAPGPACGGCDGPMPRDLAEREGWTHHPCCEPAFLRLMAEQGHTTRKRRTA